MPTFSQRLSRGLANLSGGIKGTLIPLLLQIEEEKRRTAEREESTGLRERYLNIAEEGAARRQQEFDSEQALLKEPVLGRVKRLSDIGVKAPFPAQTTGDVETLEGLGVSMATPISRLMEMVANERQAREKAASQEKRDIREQEADISGKEALATQRLSGVDSGGEQDVLKAIAEKAGLSYLKSRETRDPLTYEMVTPQLVGEGHNAPDSLRNIVSQIMGGQAQPTDTSGVQPQGDKFDLQAKSVRRDRAVQMAMQDPQFRGMTPEEQEEFLQWIEANKMSQNTEQPKLKKTTGLKQRDSRIDQAITEAMQLTGVDESWRPYLKSLAIAESSGDTLAINTWDVNAKRGTPSKGLFQVIDPTFNKHKMKGFDNIYDPTSNTVAAIRYIKQRYGHPSNVNYSGGGY